MLALSEGPPFAVHLDNFEGPFDLLLGLIAKHKLDVTEVALARVTDEFLAHVKTLVAQGSAFPLGQASEFLGFCPAVRSTTRRTWPCSRRGTCCSPGCCNTGRTRR